MESVSYKATGGKFLEKEGDKKKKEEKLTPSLQDSQLTSGNIGQKIHCGSASHR